MSRTIENIKPTGRYLGIVVLVVIQSIVGIIHSFYGFAMISGIYSVASYSTAPAIYSYYTLVYGLLSLSFIILFWMGKRSGWIGTWAISSFVILVDTTAVFSLFNVLGIPKFAALGEVPYSLFILFYLIEDHIRSKFNI